MSTENSKVDYYSETLRQREEIEAPCDPADFRVLKRIASNPDNYLVIGLGGGTVHGLAGNCALIALLEELELKPFIKQVWGCSAGSIVGGGLCNGTTMEEILTIVENIKRKGIDPPVAQLLMGFVKTLFGKPPPDGLIRGRRFRESISQGLQRQNIEDCEIPFRAIACTDDGHARKVIFRQGPLLDAICASMCLPGVILPIHDWNGEPYGYFDGGIVEKTPLVSVIEEHAREVRPTRLVVLCTHFDSAARISRPVGFLGRFLSILEHLEDVLWTHQLATADEADNCKYIVLNPRMPFGNMLDFHLVRVLYLWARKMFKQQLCNASLALRFDAR